jgi:DNA-directed RNA polymerase subunit RPC12/RpoP
MRVLSLTCNHCGASLEVPKKTRFVTCQYCSSRLEVKQTSGTIYTEVLEAIDEKTERIVQDLELIKLQNRLEQLDREWAVEKERYLLKGTHGETMVPTRGVLVIVSVIGGVFGLFWMILTLAMGAPLFFPFFGLIVVAGVIAVCIKAMSSARIYERRKRDYDIKRGKILEEIRGRDQIG